jgi:hypothetical protein
VPRRNPYQKQKQEQFLYHKGKDLLMVTNNQKEHMLTASYAGMCDLKGEAGL